MGRGAIDLELVRSVVVDSFADPASFPGRVNSEVTRNRKLSSASRRELTAVLHQAIRWRRRFWGDIPPSHLDPLRFEESLREVDSFSSRPPLDHWSTLSMERLALELSFPTWMVEHWAKKLGLARAISLALALNQPAPTTFRVNTLKRNRDEVLAELKRENVRAKLGVHSSWAIQLEERENIRALSVFKKGALEVQDEGSQLAVLASEARQGETVIDACCRSGGKSLALAAMMKNQGRIVAVDSDARPLDELKKRMRRSGAKIIEPIWVARDDPAPLPAELGKADLVVLDAPCSGMGAMRRRPWTKWSITEEATRSYADKQGALLRRYNRLVSPQGRLLYITCTLHTRENEEVVLNFLESEPDFQGQGSFRQLQPDREGTDGFFYALFRRKGAGS